MDGPSLSSVHEFRSVIDRIDGTAIWVVSEKGEFEYISDGFEEVWGISPERVKNNPSRLIETIHPEDRDQVIAEFEKPADEVSDKVYEGRVVRPDGEVRWTNVQQYPIRDEDENLLRVVGICTDITDQKRREAELRRQRDQLDRFASVLSHDLRNPLNVAGGHLSLAMEECDNDHLPPIEQALERIDELVEDLLILAREGEDVSASEPVALGDLVTSSWETVDTAEATLQLNIDRQIHADKRRVRQLIENLIRNAVEHGGEDVTVTVGELDDGFYIEDDGAGIPENKQPEVFEVGYSTATNGTGFGLSIVQQVANAHGWNVRVTNSSEGGARFEIRGVWTTTK